MEPGPSDGRRFEARAVVLLIVLVAAMLLAWPRVAWADTEEFTPPAFTTNDTGDIAIVGNTLMTCPDTAPTCDDAREGNAPGTNDNNDYSMVYVDVDGEEDTFNSSRADFALPAGGEVLWAGLYWGGRSDNAARGQVKFDTPATTDYADINGNTIGFLPSASADPYHAFANVTTLVRAGGSGTLTVADVRADTGADDRYAGWSLVVVYREPGAPPRNLTVFDGFEVVSQANNEVFVGISGFQTPPSGAVNTRVGVVAYEGDRDALNATLGLKSGASGPPGSFTTLGDAVNPTNNFFNSTISRLGTPINDKAPNYSNQLGFDADVVDAGGVLSNNTTAATLRLGTRLETYYPGVVTTAIELYAPEVDLQKSVRDENGGEVEPGDFLEYTVTATNNGQDDAVAAVVEDAIPENSVYATGSLHITAGANAGPKTDLLADDEAEYVAGDDAVRFRVGSEADGTTGGVLEPGDSTAIRFRVQVEPGADGGATVANQAEISYTGRTTGTDFTGSSPLVEVIVTPSPPTAEADEVSTREDAAAIIPVLDNDTDNVDLDPSLLTVDAEPENGSVEVNPDGTITYTPDPGFSGTDTFSYQICDATELCDAATVTVTVTPVNDRPVAADDGVTTDEDDPVTVAVLANDTDPDGNGTLDPGSVRVIDGPENGNATVNEDGTIRYTPSPDVSGTDTFTYRVCDTNSPPLCDTATATVVVRPIPEPPRADLRVRVDTPDRVAVGQKFAYTVAVTNKGPDAARGTVLTSILPRGVSFVFAPDGCTYDRQTRKVTCRLGNLADEATRNVRITVKAREPGRVTLSGCGVTSRTPDPNRVDNSTSSRSTSATTVWDPPST